MINHISVKTLGHFQEMLASVHQLLREYIQVLEPIPEDTEGQLHVLSPVETGSVIARQSSVEIGQLCVHKFKTHLSSVGSS